MILFVEIDYWERLLFETPHYVVNVAERAEDLRILQENLLLVARDYNRWGPFLTEALLHATSCLLFVFYLPHDIVNFLQYTSFIFCPSQEKKKVSCSLSCGPTIIPVPCSVVFYL